MSRIEAWCWWARRIRWDWMGLPIAWMVLLGLTLPLGKLQLIGGDEGVELCKAAHYLRGEWDDARVWNDQPLTHTRWYATLMGVFSGPAGPRLWSLLSSGVLLVSIAILTESLVRYRGAAVAAVGWMCMAPLFLELSTAAMQEVPANAFGLCSVALAARPGASRGGSLLGMAVGTAVVAISIKLTAFIYVVAAFFMLAWQPKGLATTHALEKVTPSLRSSLVYVLLVLTGARVLLAIVDGRPFADLLAPHLSAFHEATRQPSLNGEGLWSYIGQAYPALGLFFLTGTGLLLWSAVCGHSVDRRIAVLPMVCLAFNWAIKPWWIYYALSLWVAMAGIAGYATAWCLSRLRAWLGACRGHLWRTEGAIQGTLWKGLLVFLGGAVWVSALKDFTWNLYLLRKSDHFRDSRILAGLKRYTPAGFKATIFSTTEIYAFWSGFAVPGDLLVVTRKRVLSGDLQMEDVPQMVEGYQCEFVVLPVSLPEPEQSAWERTLSRGYVLVEIAEGHRLFVSRRLAPTPFSSVLHW